ncbi:MlaD family protein [Williamsia sp. CHRR-6]|uniref:MlaD family protein n=1 Tax=Williamsia sp. CHRR-6 TaxID=2835871 RepID=UPI001BD92C48|nr:MlaD family protein [Williamsia sp. CHRR-6]MBT0566576.1 MCE family protein [Williamsia sp. CHRR-6]
MITAMVVAVVVGSAGCGVQVTDLPLPGTGVSGSSHRLRIEFANVLNLPARSKVLFNGTKAGVLRSVTIDSARATPVAVATVDISDDVVLPRSTRAALRQSTLLGDIYIALTSGSDTSGPPLRPGDTIALAQTTIAPAVEDLLGGIAALASGGTVQRISDIINRTNQVFGDDATRDRALATGRALIAGIADNQTPVAQTLDSLARIAQTVSAQGADLGNALTVGPENIGNALVAFVRLTRVLNILGPNLVSLGDLLVPRAQPLIDVVSTITPLVRTAVALDASAPSDLARLKALLDQRIIPLLRAPRVDIVDFSRPDGGLGEADSGAQIRAVAATLRMIGLMR